MQILITQPQLQLIINRLAQELIEKDDSLHDIIFIGLQPRGIYVSDKIIEQIKILRPERRGEVWYSRYHFLQR
jgi:pyrimidine operon attenuation protein/uracil phosphoribosyltransferase